MQCVLEGGRVLRRVLEGVLRSDFREGAQMAETRLFESMTPFECTLESPCFERASSLSSAPNSVSAAKNSVGSL